MVPFSELLVFLLAALLLVLSPGPNMIYLVSRSICQGRSAGLISLLGVSTGFVVHMLAAALGVSAVFVTVPLAYTLLKFGGALYLLWLAWQSLRPGAKSPFEARQLPPESGRKLFVSGFMINLLNPKAVIFYLALFPQFIAPERGSVFLQSLLLGSLQILVSFCVNLAIAFSASGLASWLLKNPLWLTLQRYLMGCVLAGLAVRLISEKRDL